LLFASALDLYEASRPFGGGSLYCWTGDFLLFVSTLINC
jgi:hypothetical protein